MDGNEAGFMDYAEKSVRRHACHLCGLAFTEAFRLKRHSMTHTGEKPFPCHHCTARFARKDHLKRHLDKKHSVQINALAEVQLANSTLEAVEDVK